MDPNARRAQAAYKFQQAEAAVRQITASVGRPRGFGAKQITMAQMVQSSGISEATLYRCQQVLLDGDPELIQACRAGVLSIYKAYKMLGLTRDGRHELITGEIDHLPVRTILYRHYDKDDQLLYVGISADPYRRGKTHSHEHRWTRLAHHMTGIWYDSREEARVAEVVAIKTEYPIFNRQG